MKVLAFLKECEAFETAAQKLYEALASRPWPEAGASDLFRRLGEDEEDHARTYRFLQSLAREMDQKARVAAGFQESAARLRDACAHATSVVESRATVSLEAAVALAAKIEATAAEASALALIKGADPQFQRLIESIVRADGAHGAELERFRRRYCE